MLAEMPMQDATPAVAVEQKKPEKSVEIQKYEIDKKFEIQQQKLEEEIRSNYEEPAHMQQG